MLKQAFKEANSKDGFMFISNQHNVVIMKFKPTIRERLAMLFGRPVWVGAPIRSKQGGFSVYAKGTAFIMEENTNQ